MTAAARPLPSVKRSLGAIILGFEVIVLFLGSLTLYGMNATASLGLPAWWALVFGAVLILLSLLAIALMPRPIGFGLGWAVQVIVLLGAVLNLMLAVVGAMFLAMWWYGMRTGGRLDARDRGILAEAAEAAEADSTEPDAGSAQG